jgi:hypothetical protein
MKGAVTGVSKVKQYLSGSGWKSTAKVITAKFLLSTRNSKKKTVNERGKIGRYSLASEPGINYVYHKRNWWFQGDRKFLR